MKPELTHERRVAEIFKDAIACAEEGDRAALLERACGSDRGLRAAVEALFAADASGSLFPEDAASAETLAAGNGSSGSQAVAGWPSSGRGRSGAISAGATAATGGGPASDSIAGYTILREIHRGGQGVVYQAIQQSTNRKVAIKVLKEGPFAGPMHRARFDREVQVLGRLGHPNIVTIHDRGTAAGQHYFVMDYIAGQPLDVYMSSGARTVRQAMELFRTICDAVSAAHLMGVIHRDLKPGNICVDARGVPHVLDFGLAKIAASDADVEAMTVTGQFLGSLPWASPEQAEGATGKIDIRTDVYSLGVVLYQMLTGRFPYEVVGGMRDVLDRIMTAEPVRPRGLRREIDDEVETIVLKCLAKDRDRRYQSAGELARDVKRYLDGEPIEAKRDSVRYLLRKKLRRHRVAAGVMGAFVLVAAAGAVGTLLNARRAAANATLAAQNWEKAQTASRFLLDLIVRALAGEDRESRMRQALDGGVAMLDGGALRGLPAEEAKARRTLAEGYFGIGAYPEAGAQLELAGELMQRSGGFAPAELAEIEMRRAQALLETGDAMAALEHMRSADDLFGEAGAQDAVEVAVFKSNFAHVLGRAGENAEAERMYREAGAVLEAELAPDDLELASFRNRFAVLLRRVGKLDEAEAMMRAALSARDAVLPADHPETITARFNLAEIQLELGDFVSAEQNAAAAAESGRRALGPAHPHVASALVIRGSALTALDRPQEAEPLLRTALEIRAGYLDASQWRVASAKSALGECLSKLGRLEEAEDLLTDAARSLLTDATAPAVRKRETVDRLLALYERAARPDDAARWKAVRSKLDP